MTKTEPKEHGNKPFILILLGAITLPLAGFIWWWHVDILNTDRYVSLITPVVRDTAVQTSIANYLTDTIFSQVNTEEAILGALPNQNPVIAQLLNDALIHFSRSQILTVVQSEQFETLWGSLNRAVHQQVTRLLLGEGQLLTLQNGAVSIDLNGVLDQLKIGLSNRGLANLANRLPQQSYNYVLFQAPLLAKYQPTVVFLDSLFPWIPLLSVGLFGSAIWLSRDRIHTLRVAGKALLIVAAVEILAILLIRSRYLDQEFTQYYTQEVATVFYDAITRPLWVQVVALILFGIFGLNARKYFERKKVEK